MDTKHLEKIRHILGEADKCATLMERYHKAIESVIHKEI